jgi:protein-S-isoprenylcysteine O-methyltransferase Ste14
VVGETLVAWAVTIPVTAVIAAGTYELTQLPTAGAWIAVGCLLFVLGGWIVYAMTHSMSASDVDEEVPGEDTLEEHIAPRPQLTGEAQVE